MSKEERQKDQREPVGLITCGSPELKADHLPLVMLSDPRDREVECGAVAEAFNGLRSRIREW